MTEQIFSIINYTIKTNALHNTLPAELDAKLLESTLVHSLQEIMKKEKRWTKTYRTTVRPWNPLKADLNAQKKTFNEKYTFHLKQDGKRIAQVVMHNIT